MPLGEGGVVPPILNPDRKMLLTWNLAQSCFVTLQKNGRENSQNYSYRDDGVTNYANFFEKFWKNG